MYVCIYAYTTYKCMHLCTTHTNILCTAYMCV